MKSERLAAERKAAKGQGSGYWAGWQRGRAYGWEEAGEWRLMRLRRALYRVGDWWHDKLLCDGCDRVKRVWSSDGRTLVCMRCRVKARVFGWGRRS